MEQVSLTDTQSRNIFFERCILNSIDYWHSWLANNKTDITTLDRDRHNIVKAISFALYLEEADWPTTRSLIEIFSPYVEKRGFWENWGSILSRAIEVAQQLKDTPNEVKLSILAARLFFRQSRLKEAIKYYRRTVRLARQVGDQFNEARAYTNLGYHYAEQGQWYRAEVLCCYALQLFEQINNDHGLAHTHNHLGYLYTCQCRWEQAQLHLQQACQIWQTIRDMHGLIFGYINLGGLYIRLDQPFPALSYLKKALDLAKHTGEQILVGTIHMNIGSAYMLGGKFNQAEKHAQQAEHIFQKFTNISGLAQVWNILGDIHLRQQQFQGAKQYLKKSLTLWLKLDSTVGQIEVLLDLIALELACKNYAQAKAYFGQGERLIGFSYQATIYHNYLSRLDKYRRSLLIE